MRTDTKQVRAIIVMALYVFLAYSMPGCAALVTYMGDCFDPKCEEAKKKYYAAVRTDLELWDVPKKADRGQAVTCLHHGAVLIDIPLSFAFDTVALPFQLVGNTVLKGEPASKAYISKLSKGRADWAYPFSDEAKQTYKDKRVTVSCSDIEAFLDKGERDRAYIAIRDAGLFKDPSCAAFMEAEAQKILKTPYLRDARAFYRLRLGISSYGDPLHYLASSYDVYAEKVGDHITVELFGFLDDWEDSGRRLVRHAKNANGASAELLCSALKWRRYLYGDEMFKQNWYMIGREESVKESVLEKFDVNCRVEPL